MYIHKMKLISKSGRINWRIVLYILGGICGIGGLSFSLVSALYILLESPHKFLVSHMYLSLLMTFSFGLKTGYMWDKKLSRILLPAWSIGWFIVFLINLATFIKINFMDNKLD